MRKFILLAASLLASSYAFADLQPKQAIQLKSLGTAFKTYSNEVPKINPNDITMGYAGQDITRKPSLA